MSFRSRNILLAAAVFAATAPIAAQVHAATQPGQSANVQSEKKAKAAKPRLTAGQKLVLDTLNAHDAKYAFGYTPALLATIKSGAAKGLWTYTRTSEGTEHDALVVVKS